MAIAKLIPTDKPMPPEQLGEVIITVTVGETKDITQGDLMGLAQPPYFQEQDMPIGEVKIINYGQSPNNIVRQTGVPIIAQLTNNGNIIRYNTTTQTWTNEVVTKTNLLANNFKVKGNSIGFDYVEYIAKAYNNTSALEVESDYSNATGRLWIKVISANNLPPSSVGSISMFYMIGVPIILTPAMFTTLTTPTYVDPEGDPPKAIKILSLPTTGVLLLSGTPVTIGQEIMMTELALNKLRFNDLGAGIVGTPITFNFQVSDMGTGTFVG